MHLIGLSVMAEPKVSALLDRTKMIPENTVSITKKSSHLAPVVSKMVLREMTLREMGLVKGDS